MDTRISRRQLLKRTAVGAASVFAGGLFEACQSTAHTAVGRIYNVADFGADPSGTTNSTDVINRTIASCHAAGGGTVRFPPGIYSITRKVGATDNQQGGVYVLPGVSLKGYGATLRMDGNATHIQTAGLTTQRSSVATVTTSIARGDRTLTLDSTQGFQKGDEVFCRLGENSADTRESSYWLYAYVSKVVDSYHLTLDRPMAMAFNAHSVTDPGNRTVSKLRNAVSDVVIEGFALTQGPGGNVEACIFLDHVRRATIRDIVANDPGAGLTIYYSESVRVDRYRVNQSMKQLDQTSKGRGISFSGARQCRATNIQFDRCAGTEVLCENYSSDVELDSLDVNLTTKPTVEGVFTATQHSRLMVSRCRISGSGATSLFADTPTSDSLVTSQDLQLATTPELVSGPVLSDNGGYLVVQGEPANLRGSWRVIKQHSQFIWLEPDLPPGRWPLPSGLHRRVAVYVSSLAGLTRLNLETSAGPGLNVLPELAPGQWSEISPYNYSLTQFGSRLIPVSVTGRNLVVYTNASIAPGTYLRINLEYYAMG